MDKDLILRPGEILVGEHLYAKAISQILASAQQELLILDQSLTHGDFASLEKFEILQHFLSSNLTSRLTIILQDTSKFVVQFPRLFSLLAVYKHKMDIYETNDSAKHAKDCFILADGKNYIKRIHLDQARFKFAINDLPSTTALNTRFKELLETTHHVLTTSKLGL
jgi:hypothetical protein